jgi:hypothetical protein
MSAVGIPGCSEEEECCAAEDGCGGGGGFGNTLHPRPPSFVPCFAHSVQQRQHHTPLRPRRWLRLHVELPVLGDEQCVRAFLVGGKRTRGSDTCAGAVAEHDDLRLGAKLECGKVTCKRRTREQTRN